MLHLVGFLLTLNYDARNHELKILSRLDASNFSNEYKLPQCIHGFREM